MMGASRRELRFAAFLLNALAMLLVGFMALRADIGGDVPWDKEQAASYLTNVELHSRGLAWAFGFGIAIDACVLLVVAAVVYRLFRDRNESLAALAFAGFVANGAVSGVADALGISLTFVAGDFVGGGGTGTAPHDPGVLELGRTLGIAQLALTQIESTMFGVALIALGSLLAFAKKGAINPPRALGWVWIVAGTAAILAWGALIESGFFAFAIINGAGSVLALLLLGGWLVLHARQHGKTIA